MSNEVQMTDEAQKARIAAVYEKYGADLRKAAQNLLGDCPNAIKFNDSGRRMIQKRLRDELIQRFIRRRPVPLRLLTK